MLIRRQVPMFRQHEKNFTTIKISLFNFFLCVLNPTHEKSEEKMKPL